MIIDCHGHYTTEPKDLGRFRQQQIAAGTDPSKKPSRASLKISDDEIRQGLEGAQLKLQRERDTDLVIFSPRAMGMGHHIGDFSVSLEWSQVCNELIHRVCTLYPENFVGVCQLPQTPGVPPDNCIDELERCINEFGMVGCNLNPDPSGGHWTAPPLTDRYWYKFYEKLVELDVPAMVHVSASCNPVFHGTGAHYINADTTAFMQLISGDLFKDFPTLKLIIPHGGGAVPYHWGRYRGLAQDMKKPPLEELLRPLRLSPAGHRAAHQGDPGRQHPVRVRDGRPRQGHRSAHRPQLRRHQALHRPGVVPQRRRQAEDLRGQCPQGLQPAEGEDLALSLRAKRSNLGAARLLRFARNDAFNLRRFIATSA